MKHQTILNKGILISELNDLRNNYLKLWIGVAAVIAWGGMVRAALWFPYDHLYYTLLLPLLLVAGACLAYALHSRYPRLAVWTFILSLLTTNALETSYFPHSLSPYLFSLLAVVAAPLMSGREVLAVTALTLVTVTTVAWSFADASLVLPNMQDAALLTVLAGFIAWLGTRQFHAALRWAWESTKHAMTAAEEARAHRAELVRLNKELDSAYHRLDRMNQMLVLARQEAEEARNLKVQFANAVSHELRSPLNMIIGFSEMMVNSPEVYGPQPWPPRLQRHIHQIFQSSQHLSQLVDDVLDLAKIDAYRLALHKERASLADVIHETIEMVRSLYRARKLHMRTEIPPQLPPVSLDRARIRQVLLNLLTNALRFTQEGGVTVSVHCSETELVVSVTDTGVGIAAKDLPRLFEEFRQLDGSAYRWHSGSGLGLAISKQLVELHGGRIWAESTEGVGTTFSFSLPIHAEAHVDGQRDVSGSARFWDYLQKQAQQRKPIIVWARDEAVRRLFATHLAAYEITWASEEAELYPLALDLQPLAIVRVVSEPGDGPALSTHLLEELPGIPMVVCALPGLTRRPLLQGLTDYLVKPISRRRLVEALGRLEREIKRILIVEDESAMREFLTTALNSTGTRYRVIEAKDGGEALELTQNHQPDVILLDLGLPDMGGFELASHLNSLTNGETPIIAVTARDHPAEEWDDEPDVIYCARVGRFNQREIEKLLNASLEAFSPGYTPPSMPAPVADGAPAFSESGSRPELAPTRHRPTQNRQ